MLKIENHEENKINNEKKKPRINTTIIYLIILLLVVIYLFIYLLEHYKTPILIAFLIVLFLFLFSLGFILRKKKRSILSLFSHFRSDPSREDARKKYITQLSRKPRPDILNFNYRKPLILKCSNCGMMLTNFMKKCPKCNCEL